MPDLASLLRDNFNLLCIVAGCAILGIASGCLGCFTLLRRQSLLGDALSHAALPGVCVAFLLTGTKSAAVLLVGALASGLVGSLFILAIVRGSRVKEDSAIGIILSVFFGCGYVLLTVIKRMPDARQAGLETFLFGQAASIVPRDLVVLALLTALVLVVLGSFFKEFKLLAFDREYGVTLNYPMRTLEVLLTALVVIAVVIGLQTVGVILMAAMLVTPAAAARQWTHSLHRMVLLSGLLGSTSGVLGALVSSTARRVPTGPVVVLAATGFLLFSLAFAPRRGLVWTWLRLRRHRRKVRQENLLADLYRSGELHRDWTRSYSLSHLASIRGLSAFHLSRTMEQLQRRGWMENVAGTWRLTGAGRLEAARVVRNHRLWELFLARRLELASDHVHRDAEEMEHALPPEVIAELERMLDDPTVDPHGHVIPSAAKAGESP